MPSHVTLRMQFGPHQDPDRVTHQLLDLVRVAPVDEIMFFFYAEALCNGHETLDEIRQWIDRSRPYRTAMAELGITISLNPWHSILHCDRGRRLKPEQPWQLMVDPNGREATAMVCPLGRGWRAYYEQVLGLLAAEDFRVIWIDDDIRYHNHGDLHWGGCFCPLHVAEFNRRAGTQATRDQIVAEVAAPGTPHPWRGLWLDMWDESHVAMISRWREIVEAKGSRLGLMSSLVETHAAEGRRWPDWWQALAGDKPPIHRPHYWAYNTMPGRYVSEWIARLDQSRSIQPDNVESGPEVECSPYGRWNKSFREIGAEMSLAHVLGSTNLNVSLYDFMGNDPGDEPQRAPFLAEWRPTLDWLADLFPMTLRSVGVGVPWSPDMGRTMHAYEGGGWEALSCPSRGWTGWLGGAGQAFSTRASDHVNAVSGPIAWAFSDEQWRAWLAKGVLLDGQAAAILLERGLGRLIGVKTGRLITQAEVIYAVEQCTDAAFGLREGAQTSVNRGMHARQLFQADLVDGVHVASDIRGPKQDVVGHGLVLFENELGGRVAVVPWMVDLPGPRDSFMSDGIDMNVQRAAQLNAVVAYLDCDKSCGHVSGGPWLTPQFLTDGHVWRGVVWNGSPDAVDTFTVHWPAAMPQPSHAVHVNGQGQRADATIDGHVVRLPRPMYQYEYVVLI